MAITQVRVQLNGVWHTLTYNSATGKYEKTLVAPAVTSYNLPNHVYPLEIEAMDHELYKKAINKGIRVIERILPTINITALVGLVEEKRPALLFDVGDESQGSGIDLSTLEIILDSKMLKFDAIGMDYSKVGDRYYFIYRPPETLADGLHRVTINVSDYDGNKAIACSWEFNVFGTWIEVISDRTKADVDYIAALNTKVLTAEEWQAYVNNNYKGSFNASDLNRIEMDAVFIYKKMRYYGYGAKTLVWKTDWNKTDFMHVRDFGRLLGNIRYLRDIFISLGCVLPDFVECLGFVDVNNMESTLDVLRQGIEHLETQWVYSGEVVSGGNLL